MLFSNAEIYTQYKSIKPTGIFIYGFNSWIMQKYPFLTPALKAHLYFSPLYLEAVTLCFDLYYMKIHFRMSDD